MRKRVSNGMFISESIEIDHPVNEPLISQWRKVAEEVLEKPPGDVDEQSREWAVRLLEDHRWCEYIINGDPKLAGLAERSGRISEYGHRLVQSRAAPNIILGSKRRKGLAKWHEQQHGSIEQKQAAWKERLKIFLEMKVKFPKKPYSYWIRKTAKQTGLVDRTIQRTLEDYLKLSPKALRDPLKLKF